MDEIDLKIINLLKENARMQWKEIGEAIHLTGQAVGNRIRKLEDDGIIKKYTLHLDETKLGSKIEAFVTVIMKNTNHTGLHRFIKIHPSIVEAHRISGDGCYLLKVLAANHQDLNQLLEGILPYGNYRVNLSIGHIPVGNE